LAAPGNVDPWETRRYIAVNQDWLSIKVAAMARNLLAEESVIAARYYREADVIYTVTRIGNTTASESDFIRRA
jgi:hypothetical protein